MLATVEFSPKASVNWDLDMGPVIGRGARETLAREIFSFWSRRKLIEPMVQKEPPHGEATYSSPMEKVGRGEK